jgi:hypothetical protein
MVPDVDDPAGHPRGSDHRVVFGHGADMAGQRDDAVLGVRLHVAAVGEHRRALQCLLDVQVDIHRIDDVEDVDIVEDVADTGHPGHGRLGGSASRAVGHGPGQGDVAVLCDRLHAVRHGDVRGERVVRRGGQLHVIAVVAFRQHHLQVVVHVAHPGDSPRGGGRLQVLGVAGHGAGERDIAGDVPDCDVRGVDPRVEAELLFDRRADVLGLADWVLVHLPESFPARLRLATRSVADATISPGGP